MNLNELEALAKAETNEWFCSDDLNNIFDQHTADCIAAANPETILQLIELVREMGEVVCIANQSPLFYGKFEDVVLRFKELTK